MKTQASAGYWRNFAADEKKARGEFEFILGAFPQVKPHRIALKFTSKPRLFYRLVKRRAYVGP